MLFQCGGAAVFPFFFFFSFLFLFGKARILEFSLGDSQCVIADEKDPSNLFSPSIPQTNLVMEDFHDHAVTGRTVSSPTPNPYVEAPSLTI